MKRFLTPAFVRVQNPAERKELIEKLESIGYTALFSVRNHIDNTIATIQGGHLTCICGKPEENGNDCGTNIALFKALAAMNDSNDREQWFVCTKSYNAVGRYWCKGDWFFVERPCGPDSPLWRKATASEIIEYFSRKQ